MLAKLVCIQLVGYLFNGMKYKRKTNYYFSFESSKLSKLRKDLKIETIFLKLKYKKYIKKYNNY